jgi:TRAP-type C4-dicarboxylate transport system substrate-binding protein
MRIRVLPSKVQARTFELLGAVPMPMDLTQAIEMIKAGSIDAQENPLTNTVTYGVHKFHRFHTLSHHFYISRPIFLHREAFESWPADLRAGMRHAIGGAVRFQRDLHEAEEKEAEKVILAEGGEIAELSAAEHDAFAAPTAPLRQEAKASYGKEMFALAASPGN